MNKQELESRIQLAAQKYYTDGSSMYSDEEFDAMVDQLRKMDPTSPILSKIGWGYTPLDSYRDKQKHIYGHIGSLDKCREYSQVSAEIQNADKVDISLKLDGMSIVLYFVRGQLQSAVTRGDGEVGVVITSKLKVILSYMTLNIPEDFTGAIRGEVLMSKSAFQEYQSIHPDAKNPRNTAAGILNNKEDVDLEYLSLLVYTIVGSIFPYTTIYAVRSDLISMFGVENVVPHVETASFNSDNFLVTMDKYRELWYKDLPADGLVLTASIEHNSTTHEIVYCAQAYKFPSEIVETEVVDVIYTMSKTRYAIPRIQVVPVNLAGTTVQYASGHNAKYIYDNKIDVGAKIHITKANEIIPYVVDVITPAADIHPLESCPICKHQLTWKGVHLVCSNQNCQNAIEQDTIVWISALVPQDGFGSILMLKYLYDMQETYDWPDISIETIMRSNIAFHRTSSVQDNQWATIWDALHSNAVDIELSSAIAAINIPRFGEKTRLKLSQVPDLVKQLYVESREGESSSSLIDRLQQYVGVANTESILSNIDKIDRLRFIWDRIIFDTASACMLVAITGSMNTMSRRKFVDFASKYNIQVSDICKDTDYLICNDTTSSSSKLKYAQQHNIPIITESAFLYKFCNQQSDSAVPSNYGHNKLKSLF